MNIAITTCILGDFDKPVDPVGQQGPPHFFYRWTDGDFPPVVGLTPRLQYRIPKTHAWQMLPNYDAYVWLDGSLSFEHPESLNYYLGQLGDNDIAFFAHPHRHSISEEVVYIDSYLNREQGTRRGQDYIISRYKNGGHIEQLMEALNDDSFVDNQLFHSGTFIYRNSPKVQEFMKDWLYSSVRHFTCDQVALPWLLHRHQLKVATMDEPIYKTRHVSLVSSHR